jgi:hypothetical protein
MTLSLVEGDLDTVMVYFGLCVPVPTPHSTDPHYSREVPGGY